MSKLVLEKCSLGLRSIELICKGLEDNVSVLHLNLAKNNISDNAAGYIANMVTSNHHIHSLDLNDNNLRGNGGTLIFTQMLVNDCIVELDLSWNSIGGQGCNSTAAFAEVLLTNKSLKHLDISYNKFTLSECEILAEALAHNHTILGLHVAGN